MAGTTRPAGRAGPWLLGIAGWALAFAAPHLYWAGGGRRGLGEETSAADDALATPWFAAYNLVVAVLAVVAGVLALALFRRGVGLRARPWVRRTALAAATVLLVRGALGVVLLLVDAVTGTDGQAPPLVLLAVEPWFVVGGCLHLGAALSLWAGAAEPARRDCA
ncbi:DUF3995 domain-containing protein [Blastococcus aurantiacus]|uniref:DUF3995 domain-containing protein n=1 Tax=Blastococcus aurantiacus TaxID=1550231 RepID=UPI0015A480A3|nr:DUF3995 domain-containing protein [Blastococcus aurantiacus]